MTITPAGQDKNPTRWGQPELAEGVGFEPTVPCDTTVFETVRFVRSRIPSVPGERLVMEARPDRAFHSVLILSESAWKAGGSDQDEHPAIIGQWIEKRTRSRRTSPCHGRRRGRKNGAHCQSGCPVLCPLPDPWLPIVDLSLGSAVDLRKDSPDRPTTASWPTVQRVRTTPKEMTFASTGIASDRSEFLKKGRGCHGSSSNPCQRAP